MFTFESPSRLPHGGNTPPLKKAKRQASLPTGPLVRFSDITTEYNSTY